MHRLSNFFTAFLCGFFMIPINIANAEQSDYQQYAQFNSNTLKQFFSNPSSFQNKNNQQNIPQNSPGSNWQQHQHYHNQSQSQQNNRNVIIYFNGYPWGNNYPYYNYNPNYYTYAATQIWVWSAVGEIPRNAVVYQNINGSSVYYCRVNLDNVLFSGVMVPNDGCYVQVGDQSIRYSNYQVLVTLGY